MKTHMLQVPPGFDIFLPWAIELQIKSSFYFKDTKRLLEGSLLNETKRMFFYYVILCLYTEKSFLLFILH